MEQSQRQAAAHEAGHFVAGILHGLQSKARIWQGDDRWHGNASHLDDDSTDRETLAIIAVAGAVGEYLTVRGDAEPQAIVDYINARPNVLSEGDRTLLGSCNLPTAVANAFTLLRENCGLFDLASDWLVKHHKLAWL